MILKYLFYKFMYVLTKDIYYKYLYRNCIKNKNNKIIFIYANKTRVINHSYRTKKMKIYFGGNNNTLTIKMPNPLILHSEINSDSSNIEIDDKIEGSLHIDINGSSNHIKVNKNHNVKDNKLENVNFFIEGEKNKINIYPKIINSNLNISGKKCSININRNVSLNNSIINISSPSEIIENSHINIGKFTTFECVGMQMYEDSSSILIGDDCQFSWGVDIWCSDSHTILNDKNEVINIGKKVEISDHVWVGKDSKICKNVFIPKNCIIGWGTIVTHSFDEPNSLIVGIPAKIVKRNVSWDRARIKKYLEVSKER